jgi:hypothetical protein
MELEKVSSVLILPLYYNFNVLIGFELIQYYFGRIVKLPGTLLGIINKPLIFGVFANKSAVI